MKKLLMLMLVLGLASVASAVIAPGTFNIKVSATGVAGSYVEAVDSMVILYPSDTLWIGINNTVDGTVLADQKGLCLLGIQNTIVGYEGEDPIYHADTVWTMAQQTYRPPLVAGAPDPANEYWGIGDVGQGVPLSVWQCNLNDATPGTFNLMGVLDAKELHCVGPASDDVIWLIDAESGVVFDTLIIHQVPEPATMLLLGLGGLLLRRRNK